MTALIAPTKPGRRGGSTRRGRGFGLIEVMISASLLAIAVGGTMTLISQLNKTYEHQRLMNQALHLAEGQMESLLLEYSTDSDLTQGAHTGQTFDVAGKLGGTFFAASWDVQTGVPIPDVRQVTVTVTWAELGVTRRITLSTVRT